MVQALRDYLTIVRSGLFMHSAYANRYLGSRRLLLLSLIHYIVSGEARGYRPNPFFDPASPVWASLRGCRLATYLRDTNLWFQPPSDLVDPVWYASTYAIGPRTQPLEHFWREGFAAGDRPSPRFDTCFFKEVVAFYRPDKKEYAFEIYAGDARAIPPNADVLLEAQAAFFEAIRPSVCKRMDRPSRPYLVVVQATAAFINPYRGEDRDFDVLLNDYSEPGPNDVYDPSFDYIVTQRGTKTTAIRRLLQDFPDVLTAYSHVLFLDDDIILGGDDVGRLFAIAASSGLDLAQASLSASSFCAFDALKQPQAGAGLTPLTAVEIMMPLISRRVLQRCGWVFAQGISGWAVDFLLGAEVRKVFGNRIALIGDVVARHERPIDTEGGAFYRFLRSHNLDAATEAGWIAHRFEIEVSASAIRKHGAPLDCSSI